MSGATHAAASQRDVRADPCGRCNRLAARHAGWTLATDATASRRYMRRGPLRPRRRLPAPHRADLCALRRLRPRHRLRAPV